jgi:protein-S-isoprenylcysteine O-methyltransferase Ste14
MISGVLLIVFAESLIFRSVPLAEWAAAFAVINMIYIPILEEPQLRWRFGDEYQEYKRNVPRLLPRLRPWNRETLTGVDSHRGR